MTTPADLRRLLEAATPRPWERRGERLDTMIVGPAPARIIVADPCVFNPQDEPLALAAINSLETLLEVVEAAKWYVSAAKAVTGEAESWDALQDAVARLEQP